MIKRTIAGWTIEYDKEATQSAYKALPADTLCCDCQICRNFSKAVSNLPKTVFEFFEQFGVDVTKPIEIYDLFGKNGRAFYGGWYHVVGNFLSGNDVLPITWFEIDSDYEISFTRDVHLAREGFPKPTLQMEVMFNLPWILEEEYKEGFI
jgi:hypothetical protein